MNTDDDFEEMEEADNPIGEFLAWLGTPIASLFEITEEEQLAHEEAHPECYEEVVCHPPEGYEFIDPEDVIRLIEENR
jgi:hypothetical protein